MSNEGVEDMVTPERPPDVTEDATEEEATVVPVVNPPAAEPSEPSPKIVLNFWR